MDLDFCLQFTVSPLLLSCASLRCTIPVKNQWIHIFLLHNIWLEYGVENSTILNMSNRCGHIYGLWHFANATSILRVHLVWHHYLHTSMLWTFKLLILSLNVCVKRSVHNVHVHKQKAITISHFVKMQSKEWLKKKCLQLFWNHCTAVVWIFAIKINYDTNLKVAVC